ncbi:unnamed protein product [Lampetra planeri]
MPRPLPASSECGSGREIEISVKSHATGRTQPAQDRLPAAETLAFAPPRVAAVVVNFDRGRFKVPSPLARDVGRHAEKQQQQQQRPSVPRDSVALRGRRAEGDGSCNEVEFRLASGERRRLLGGQTTNAWI